MPPGTEVALDMGKILNDRTVRGILAGDSIADLFIPVLIKMYLQGRFPFDRMIKFYSFNETGKALEDVEKGTALKPVLYFHVFYDALRPLCHSGKSKKLPML